MAVNTVQLQSDLEAHGTVIICGEHSEDSYLVVMEGVADHDAAHDVIDSYVLAEYPNQTNCTWVDGVLKCEKTK